jgi:Mg2+ and Co2+ transporter CorA
MNVSLPMGEWENAFSIIIILMVILSALLIIIFKKRGWFE